MILCPRAHGQRWTGDAGCPGVRPPLGACIPKPRPPSPWPHSSWPFQALTEIPGSSFLLPRQRDAARPCLHGGFCHRGAGCTPSQVGMTRGLSTGPCGLGTFVSRLARVLSRTLPEGQPVPPLRKATWWSAARQGRDQILAHCSHLWPASPKSRQRCPREFSGQISSLCKEVIGIRHN